MDFDLKEVLEAIGPSAALVFASWIFLGFLEQRYVAAYERFRKLVEEYRANQSSETRHQNLGDQIRLYRVRCDQMRTATNLGVFAAILLLTTLICGALEAIFGGIAPLNTWAPPVPSSAFFWSSPQLCMSFGKTHSSSKCWIAKLPTLTTSWIREGEKIN
jgi:hypothetical protein